MSGFAASWSGVGVPKAMDAVVLAWGIASRGRFAEWFIECVSALTPQRIAASGSLAPEWAAAFSARPGALASHGR